MKTLIITAVATTLSAIVIAAIFYVAINNATVEEAVEPTSPKGIVIKDNSRKVDAGETIDRRDMVFASCKRTVMNRMANNYKGFSSKLLVNTNVLYKVRVWMPENAITLTCFESTIKSTRHNYL